MAAEDMVDLGAYVEAFPSSTRNELAAWIGYLSIPAAGHPSVWPPNEDPIWSGEDATGGGRFWQTFMTEDVFEYRNYEYPPIAAEWGGDFRSYHADIRWRDSASRFERLGAVLWFDTAGAPGGPFNRADLIWQPFVSHDDDGKSLTIDFITSYSVYTDGDNEPYTPADFNASWGPGDAMSPASLSLSFIDAGIWGDLSDPDEDGESLMAWPLTGQALERAVSGQRVGLRFRLIPEDEPAGENAVNGFTFLRDYDEWVANGRNLADYEDIQFSAPRLRLWRGGEPNRVSVEADITIPMTLSARLRGAGRRMNEHRARQLRDARR